MPRTRKRLRFSGCHSSRSSTLTSSERIRLSLTRNPENTCCSSVSDIPGFYYDEDKKRYFRILPGNNNNNPLTTESIKLAEIEKSRVRRAKDHHPRKCLTAALINSQRGFSTPFGFSSIIQEGRMSNFKCVNRVRTEDVIELSAEKCKYLCGRPEDGIAVGAWPSESDGFVIHSISLDVDSNVENGLIVNRGSVVNIHPYVFQLTDLCVVEVSPKLPFALYVGSHTNPESAIVSVIHLLPLRSECDQSTPENRELVDCRSQNYEFLGKHLWSCSFNEHTKTIFAGGESTIYQFGVENVISSEYSITNESVFSLSTNANGHALYAGTNKGHLTWFDTRSQSRIGNLKIGRGLSYIKALSDENKIVASSFDDSLVQVDLRQQRVLISYVEHNNKHRKLPFSVDELTNILCSAGQDRITRLWSLQDGKLLTSVFPPENIDPSAELWTWYSDHWNTKSKMHRSSLLMSADKEIMLYSQE